MKNSIQFIAIAFLSFSNVISASGLNPNEKCCDTNITNAKTVTFANENLFETEVDGLQNYVATIADIMIADKKITENETTLKTSTFVSYANDQLVLDDFGFEETALNIENQIKNDAKITESIIDNATQNKFVHYSDINLIQLELDTLTILKTSISEIIQTNLATIEDTKSNAKNDNQKAIAKYLAIQ